MGKVVAAVKVFPSDPAADLAALKAKIRSCLPADVTAERFDEEPIAFGLVALTAYIVMPEDSGGKMEAVEEALKSMEDVSEIQVVRVGRMGGT